jgi:hypothetical protein
MYHHQVEAAVRDMQSIISAAFPSAQHHHEQLAISLLDREIHQGYQWADEHNLQNAADEKFAELLKNNRPTVIRDAIPVTTPEEFVSTEGGSSICRATMYNELEISNQELSLADFFNCWKTSLLPWGVQVSRFLCQVTNN